MLDGEQLRESHRLISSDAHRLRHAVQTQIEALAHELKVTLAVPIESRVKSVDSLEEKLKRKEISLAAIEDLDDLIGVRAILLFQRDVNDLCSKISDSFSVISAEDTRARLLDTQFGYQSKHYVVRLPDSWLGVPTMKGLDRLKAEIQVRTLAQHSWASASHKLQYKQELGVPEPIRRSIHRVSALLETVDLEFERVLDERDHYIAQNAKGLSPDDELNVDLLASAMQKFLPEKFAQGKEGGDQVLSELRNFGVTTVERFEALVRECLPEALKANDRFLKISKKERASRDGSDSPYLQAMKARREAGIYFTQTGLVRQMLRTRFGAEYDEWYKKAFSDSSQSSAK